MENTYALLLVMTLSSFLGYKLYFNVPFSAEVEISKGKKHQDFF